jgi:CSLREA domain-containing protein
MLPVVLAFVGVARPAYAAFITVTTTADELNSDHDGSLREAIQAANGNVAVDRCPAGTASGPRRY